MIGKNPVIFQNDRVKAVGGVTRPRSCGTWKFSKSEKGNKWHDV